MLLGILRLSFPLSVMAMSQGAVQSHRYRKLSDQPPIFLCCLTCTLGGGSQYLVSDINVGD
jgi:hypothetical protein